MMGRQVKGKSESVCVSNPEEVSQQRKNAMQGGAVMKVN